MNAVARLDTLAQAHPEWSPWLRVVRELVAELADPAWEAGPPSATAPASDRAPRLDGAELRPDGPALARLLDRLVRAARAEGLQAMAGTGEDVAPASPDGARAVFLAAVNEDEALLAHQASQRGASPEGWRTLARLLPMPYLHACARRWAARPEGRWSQGYCPVCGAWPAFAELRGVERSRHLRCGRCAAAWPIPLLTCTYCGTTDHDKLGTLAADDRKSRFGLDVCHGCSGYLKTCTTLQATPPDEVLAADLASIEYDLAAVERGFQRPPGPGVVLGCSLAVDLARPEAPWGR